MNASLVKFLIFSLVLFSSSVGMVGYMVYTQEAEGESIRESLVRFRLWSDLRSQTNNQESLKKEQQDKEFIRSLVLSSESDTVRFLAFIDDLADQTDTNITATELETKKTKQADFKDLSVNLFITGSREAVEYTVQIMERLPYNSRVTELILNRTTTGLASANVSLLVSVKK